MEKKAKRPALKAGLIYGAIIGFVSIVIAVILDLLGLTMETWAGLISLLITVLLVIYSLKAYKKEYLGGKAKYEQLMLMTLFMALVSTVLSTVYSIINLTLIDPDALDKMYNFMYEKMANNPRMTEDVLDMVMERMEGRFTFGRVVIQGFIGGYIMTVIIGVIVGAFVKTKADKTAENVG
jgi:hypothetical protein